MIKHKIKIIFATVNTLLILISFLFLKYYAIPNRTIEFSMNSNDFFKFIFFIWYYLANILYPSILFSLVFFIILYFRKPQTIEERKKRKQEKIKRLEDKIKKLK